MQIKKFIPTGKNEKTVQLKDAGVGSIIRFPEFTFEEVMSGKDEATFYMVINDVHPRSANSLTLVSLDGKLIIQRDADRLVVVHQADIHIHEN